MIKKKHVIIGLSLTIVLFLLIFVNLYYQKIYKANFTEDAVIYIPSNANYDEVEALVHPFAKRMTGFRLVVKLKKYKSQIKSGKYLIKKGMSNNDLVNLLRSGNQKPVKVSYNNQDSFEKLAGRISQQIEADSISLLNVFNNENFLDKNGFNKATALCMYIPNSYELYWNTNANEFQQKMLKEYKRFWNKNRKEKAKELNLSPIEVSILASIVHKETAHIAERPSVAGLYLNRLRDKWPLQADPTVIFAMNKEAGKDLNIKRVLTKHTELKSEYNTYHVQGLPPGPIGMPDVSAIDAVLNPKKHEYFYMCASTTNIGQHAFARTNAQHAVNARKYHAWMDRQ